MSNGLIVYTDPNNSDTDGDGLTDGEEVGQLKRIQGFNLDTPEEAVVYKFYFNIKSDPTKIDTQKSQKLLDYLTEELNKMMPPEYDENGNKINAQNKECSKTWNYFNKYIWIYLLEYTTSPQSKYAAYTAWLRETYGTSGLEKFWTTTDKYAEIFYYEITHITDTIPKSIKQIFYGNYSEEITITGTAGQIVVGFSGIDFVADIRDVTYDIDHWEWSWSHAGQTCLDMIGILPIVGVLKNCDEFAALKNISRIDADNAIEESIESINAMLKAGKNVDEIAGIERVALVNKLNKLVEADITKIAEKYENFQCVECADKISSFLKTNKLEGEIVEFNITSLTGDKFSNVFSDSLNTNISTNGYHCGVKFNGKIYDNMNPNGVDFEDWLNDLYCPASMDSLYQLYKNGYLDISFNDI